MRVRFVGFIDDVLEVEDELWLNAKDNEDLQERLSPYFSKLNVNLTYGREDEFDGLEQKGEVRP